MDIQATIEEYLGAKQNSITQSTYDWYAFYLGKFSDFCTDRNLTDLTQITPNLVQQFVSSSETNNTHTRHARAQIVKGFLSWCALDDDLGVREKTVRRISMPKVEQSEVVIFSEDEIRRLFAACDKTQQPYRNRAILHLLLDTGCRAAEICLDSNRRIEQTGLLQENLVLGRGEYYILVIGKGRKVRSVGLGDDTVQAMRRYLNRERGRSDSPYVFLSREGEPLSVRMLEQLLEALGKLAHVEDVHPHRFRHTFAVRQLLNGTSSLVLMQLLGHTTLDATKIYTRSMTHIQARMAAPSVVDKMMHRR